MVGIAVGGCKRNQKAEAKQPAPAKVSKVADEEALASIVLTPQAEQRLAIVTAPAVLKPVARRRTYGGELIVALARADDSSLQGSNSPAPNHSIYSLLPAMTAADMVRLAEMQVEADGQIATAQIQLEAAHVSLRRAESLLAEKAGSIRVVDEAKAQVALAEAALQVARKRRELLGRPLFEAVNQDALWVRVPVYAGDLQQLDTSGLAQVSTLGAKTNQNFRPATFVPVPVSSAGAATVDLFFELQNKDKVLRAGQRVSVQIASRAEEQSLVVPSSALFYDIHGGTWVFESTAPHGFTRRRVDVRFVDNSEAVLARGVQPGAQIVIAGVAELVGAEFGFAK